MHKRQRRVEASLFKGNSTLEEDMNAKKLLCNERIAETAEELSETYLDYARMARDRGDFRASDYWKNRSCELGIRASKARAEVQQIMASA